MDNQNFEQFLNSWADKDTEFDSPSSFMDELLSIDENDSKNLISDQPIVLIKENGKKLTLVKPSK